VPKKTVISGTVQQPPEKLENHIFYGLVLDEEQKAFRDAIWSNEYDIVFCNATAGCGKTTIATGVANLLVKHGRYKGIVYIVSPCEESRQGFLPGDIVDKSSPYMEGFYQALQTIGVNTGIALNSDILNQKRGTGYIETCTHTFLRGINLENRVVIVDESQNYDLHSLKKTLTRMHDTCKVIVIGHEGQIDHLHPTKSGFVKYLEHFRDKPRAAICTLTTNHRGWISSHADSLTN